MFTPVIAPVVAEVGPTRNPPPPLLAGPTTAFTAGGNRPTNVDYVPRSAVQQRIAPTTSVRMLPVPLGSPLVGTLQYRVHDGSCVSVSGDRKRRRPPCASCAIRRWPGEFASLHCFPRFLYSHPEAAWRVGRSPVSCAACAAAQAPLGLTVRITTVSQPEH